MKAEMAAEITRLHALHLAGKFDWRVTTTSLSWLGRKQATQASGIPARVVEIDSMGDAMGGEYAEWYEIEREGLV